MKPHNIIQNVRMVVLICLMLLSCAQSATAQVNLVFNGGFDVSSNGLNPDGWTLSGPASYNVKNGNPAPDVVLQGLGKASQTINNLNSGTIYIVSGDYQGTTGGSSTIPSFGVAFDGVYMFEVASPTNLNWYSFNFEYIATSSSAVLSLSQINLAGNGYSIDNIAMDAIPEPSATSLILLGSGLLIGVRSRIQRRMRQCRLSLGAGRQ
ncbi:MAG: PEP-CTERM sorting domain-containing protein [Verrucomicrobiia bacterium]